MQRLGPSESAAPRPSPYTPRMLRVAALTVLVALAACRTRADAAPPPSSAASTPPAIASKSPAIAERPQPAGTPQDPRYVQACEDYILGYCEETEDSSVEAVSGTDLPEDRRAVVLARCVEALESVDASDADFATFEGCRGCVGNCSDLDACLPDPNTPWRVPEGDCGD